jgi:hypothetical protein
MLNNLEFFIKEVSNVMPTVANKLQNKLLSVLEVRD